MDDLFLAKRIMAEASQVMQATVYQLRRAMAVTSNSVVQDWGKYLGDLTMAGKILEQLMHCRTML